MIKHFFYSLVCASIALSLNACKETYPDPEKLTGKEMIDILVKVKGADFVETEVLVFVTYVCSMHQNSFKNKPKELDCITEKKNKNYEVFREEIIPLYKKYILNKI